MMVLFVWLAIALVFILEMVLVCAVAVALAVFGMTIYDAVARSGIHYVEATILVFSAPFLGIIVRMVIENAGLWPWPWSKNYPLHHLFWG